MATSERKRAANRANAQRSTGPRTDAGKRKVARNAIVHGLTARAAVLHGDDVREFRQFARRIFDELRPDGAMQVQLTEEIINYSWRLRRVPGAEQILFIKHHTVYKPGDDTSDADENDGELLELECDDDDDVEDDQEHQIARNTPVGALCSMIEAKRIIGGKPKSPVWLLDRYAARLERARASALRMLLALQRRPQARDEEVDVEDEDGDHVAVASPARAVVSAVPSAIGDDADREQILTSQNKPNASQSGDGPQVNVLNGDAIDESTEMACGDPGTKPTGGRDVDPPNRVEPDASIGESPPATT